MFIVIRQGQLSGRERPAFYRKVPDLAVGGGIYPAGTTLSPKPEKAPGTSWTLELSDERQSDTSREAAERHYVLTLSPLPYNGSSTVDQTWKLLYKRAVHH